MDNITKTKEELEDIFREMALSIMGLPGEDKKTVRFPYGSDVSLGSAPGFSRSENVVFIYVEPKDGEVNKQKNLSTLNEGTDGKLTTIDEHTDLYGVRFVCYGPDSFEWAKNIRNGVSEQRIKEFVHVNNIFLVLGVPAPIPAHELFNGEWYRRYDLNLTYNVREKIVKKDNVGTIEKVNLTVDSEKTSAKNKHKRGVK